MLITIEKRKWIESKAPKSSSSKESSQFMTKESETWWIWNCLSLSMMTRDSLAEVKQPFLKSALRYHSRFSFVLVNDNGLILFVSFAWYQRERQNNWERTYSIPPFRQEIIRGVRASSKRLLLSLFFTENSAHRPGNTLILSSQGVLRIWSRSISSSRNFEDHWANIPIQRKTWNRIVTSLTISSKTFKKMLEFPLKLSCLPTRKAKRSFGSCCFFSTRVFQSTYMSNDANFPQAFIFSI